MGVSSAREAPHPMTDTAHAAMIDTADLNLDPYWMPFTHNRYFKQQ